MVDAMQEDGATDQDAGGEQAPGWSPAAVHERLSGYRAGAAIALLVALGDELGLYRVMSGRDTSTPLELSAELGLDTDLLAAWLRAQVRAGLLVEEAGGYRLPRTVARCLAEDDRMSAMAAAFAAVPWEADAVRRVADCFRDGSRLPSVAYDRRYRVSRERARGPWVRTGLVRLVLPRLLRAREALTDGGDAADLGCGTGGATCALARRFPHARFVGIDRSSEAVAHATERAARDRVPNVAFVVGDASEVADVGRFDVVTAFDALHEIADPVAIGTAAREALRAGGTWLVEDFRPPTAAGYDPPATLLDLTSLLVCLHGADRPPEGALAFPPERARDVAVAAGFAELREHDVGHPVHLHYEFLA